MPQRSDVPTLRDLLRELRPMDVNGGTPCRVGCPGDGGYVILGDDRLRATTLYSYGIADNDSFDRHFRRIFGCEVRQFDHSVSPPEPRPGFSLKVEAIAAEPGPDAGTFSNHVTECGDQDSPIFLKMDVEGAEWDVLASLPQAMLLQCVQIVCELHDLSGRGVSTAYPSASISTRLRGLRALNTHFNLWHVHANNYAPVYAIEGLLVPDVLEVTFVSKEWHKARGLASRSFPTPLDDPCRLRDEDLQLDFWPFRPEPPAGAPTAGHRDGEIIRAQPKPVLRRRLDRLGRSLQRKPWR